MPLLKFKCDETQCSVFQKCCFLPTSYFPIDGHVPILFVGMGGGREEREQHRPFVGDAGKRLKTCILEVKRQLRKPFGVAFSNTIRDNPEDNREPTEEELNCCLKYLYADIQYLKKAHGLKVIMPLGNHAKRVFVDNQIGITLDRENIYKIENEHYGSIIIKPSFHPSYLIRNGKFNLQKGNDKLLIEDILESLNAV